MLPDLDSAIESYLRAYAEYQKFLKASENLYKVFASGWRGSPRHCAEAYATFTESLRKDWTCDHFGVVDVILSRNPNSE
jgi:TolA-binding protein